MNKQSRRRFLETSALTGALLVATPLTSVFGKQNDCLPANQTGLTFLFQGDSITDGKRGRNLDPNHIMGHGYVFSVTSRIAADFACGDFTFYNRGISGNTVSDLLKRWDEDAISLKPDVLSILVGINDAAKVVKGETGAISANQFEQEYREILRKSKEANPDVLLILGLPFVYAVGSIKDKWERWQEEVAIRKKIVKRLSKEYGAILVDYSLVFDKAMKTKLIEYWIWDGVHPTIAGHELMAREWFRKVSEKLPFLRLYGGG